MTRADALISKIRLRLMNAGESMPELSKGFVAELDTELNRLHNVLTRNTGRVVPVVVEPDALHRAADLALAQATSSTEEA